MISEELTKTKPKTIWEWARIVLEDERAYIGKRKGAQLFGKWVYTDGNQIVDGATLEEMVAQLRARFGVGFYGLIEWPLTYTNWASLKIICPIAYWVVEISDTRAPKPYQMELDLTPLAEECGNNWAKMRDCLMRYLAYSFLELEQVWEEKITKQPSIQEKKKPGQRRGPTTLYCLQLIGEGVPLEEAAKITEKKYRSDIDSTEYAKMSPKVRDRLIKTKVGNIKRAVELAQKREAKRHGENT